MARLRKGNRDLIKDINRNLVLNLIKSQGPISRADLARLSGLSPASISGISADLIANNMVQETGEGQSSGGRRPIMLAINPRGGFVVGLKLSEQQIAGVLTDLEATVIANHQESLNDRSLDKTITALANTVNVLLKMGEIDHEQLLGIGLGLAGILDAQQGVLRYSPIFGWRDVPISDLLREHAHVPVYVDNDVNTFTLTEKWFGKGQGFDNMLTITIGRGVGLGIIMNGQLYRGFQGGAGEFGHTVIDPEGTLCACGKRGCLETFVSDPSIMRFAKEAIDSGTLPDSVQTLEDLQAAATDGNSAALAIYAQAGEVLGRGIANLINVFSPQLVIVSGEGVQAGELIFQPMHDSINRHVMPGLREDTKVEVDIWNDDAWARGAAGLVLQALFESPVHQEAEKAVF
jgi:glucokinase-like ROK family protein